ncbi:S41 family peptidase [Herbidospora cretacea]|uniref:S41 family peptidase n=1 Tax=Herbidospora cretacea TaxID=28444 RepID=UPI0009ED7030|nr:S41 family peptidase [Herbidospora cretacea]
MDVTAVLAAAAADPRPEAAAPQPVWTVVPGTLAGFLATAGTLTLDQRRLIVRQALLVFEQNFAHLPLKVAMHGVNPVQRLRLLDARLSGEEDPGPEWAFHFELQSIFHSVRDLHTGYRLPAPFADHAAFLPFRIEEAFEDGAPRYVVTQVNAALLPVGSDLAVGVTVTHWNGVPVGRAADVNGERYAGSNLAARHARGLDSLTQRALAGHLPPDEEWVTLSYVDLDGKPRELTLPWLVLRRTVPAPPVGGVAPRGVDIEGEELASIRGFLFPPGGAGPSGYTATGIFLWREVETASGTFGHVRITGFSLGRFTSQAAWVAAVQAHVEAFASIVTSLPGEGLIIDIRGNPGGHIVAGEILLQFLTHRRVQPEPAQMISSPLNLLLARTTGDYAPWERSLALAVRTGAVYSDAFPLSSEELVNAFGQFYHGPVVLITDARCYSTSDIFAAGFADHGIGTIIGTDGNTGAGGANVVGQADLLDDLKDVPGSPYRKLPAGAEISVAIRRTLRVGESAGTPLEDLGVVPQVRHRLTVADLLGGNPDLMETAGRELAKLPRRRLRISLAGGTLHYDTLGLDRVDFYVDGRPRGSADVTDGPGDLPLEGERVRAEGFLRGDLVAVATA